MNIELLIKQYANEIFNDIVRIRRHIHKHPELSFQEFETAKFVKKHLSDNNIEYDESFGGNAVIGIIEGKNKGITVALRADMDALAIQETNTVDYASINNGVMHACGHDVHTASLIGTAIILNKLKEFINGRIILIFQPAEELDPGGAKILIDKGLLDKYKIDRIIGQHVLPDFETGKFGFTPGKSMAATNELYLKFTGKGGHAAIPELRSDTVLALTNSVNQIVKLSDEYSTKEAPAVIAFGKIIAEGAINIVPSISIAEGTMRTFDEDVRTDIKKRIKLIAEQEADKFGCEAAVEIKQGYPHLFNDIELTNNIMNYASEYLSPDSVSIAEMRMTGEDFAYFAQQIPATYYRMGVKGNGKGSINLHNSNFDIDEEAFLYSAGLMAYLAIKISQ